MSLLQYIRGLREDRWECDGVPLWYDPHKKYKVSLRDLCDALGVDPRDVALGPLVASSKAVVPDPSNPGSAWLSVSGMQEVCSANGKADEFDVVINGLGYPELDPFHDVEDERADMAACRANPTIADGHKEMYKRLVSLRAHDVAAACRELPGIRAVLANLLEACDAAAEQPPSSSGTPEEEGDQGAERERGLSAPF